MTDDGLGTFTGEEVQGHSILGWGVGIGILFNVSNHLSSGGWIFMWIGDSSKLMPILQKFIRVREPNNRALHKSFDDRFSISMFYACVNLLYSYEIQDKTLYDHI